MSTFTQHPYNMLTNSESVDKPDEYSLFSPSGLLTAIHDLDPNIRYTARHALGMFVPRHTDVLCPRCRCTGTFSIYRRKVNAAGEMIEYKRSICDRCDNMLRRERYHRSKFANFPLKRRVG